MRMATHARRLAKTVMFIALFCLFARLIDSSQFIGLATANAFAAWLHGSASQENYDDLWFFVDVTLSVLSAVVAYHMVMLLGRKLRASSGHK